MRPQCEPVAPGMLEPVAPGMLEAKRDKGDINNSLKGPRRVDHDGLAATVVAVAASIQSV